MHVRPAMLLLVLALAEASAGTRAQDAPSEPVSVQIRGAERAVCYSPQAIGAQGIAAPGALLIAPRVPIVEVICNAPGYQESYVRFEGVYRNDAGEAADAFDPDSLGGSIVGAPVGGDAESPIDLPERLIVTMVPLGAEEHGILAQADYGGVAETLPLATELAPPYTRAPRP